MKYIKHLLVFFFVKLPVQLAGIPILAVLLLFIPKDQEYLPRLFRWWDNHERYFEGNSSDDGLSGPDYIRNKWNNPTGWCARFNWLALRNPANYFQYKHLGFKVENDIQQTLFKGNPNVGTHEWNDRGYYYVEIRNGGKKYWEYYVVQPLFGDYHFRLRAGWKIGKVADRRPGEHRQWVLAITPLKRLN